VGVLKGAEFELEAQDASYGVVDLLLVGEAAGDRRPGRLEELRGGHDGGGALSLAGAGTPSDRLLDTAIR
jgi:hypothetical protein